MLSVTRAVAQFITRFVQGDNKQMRAALLSLENEAILATFVSITPSSSSEVDLQNLPFLVHKLESPVFYGNRKFITSLKRTHLVFHNICQEIGKNDPYEVKVRQLLLCHSQQRSIRSAFMFHPQQLLQHTSMPSYMCVKDSQSCQHCHPTV